MRASLFYATYAATQRWQLLTLWKVPNLVGLRGRAKCFFSQSSKANELIFNTMFYDIALAYNA